jgi:hypothetical protein
MTAKDAKFICNVYQDIMKDNKSLTNDRIKKAYDLIVAENNSTEKEIVTIIRWMSENKE